MTKTLIATVGLPRSGKSTWSLAYSKEHGIPIVNPDSVRLAIHGQRFILAAEQFVWATVNAMIKALFLAGHREVILDATNITRKRRDLLKLNDCNVEFHVMDASGDVCRQRAADSGDLEIIPTINKMDLEFEPLESDEEAFIPLGPTGRFPDGKCDANDDGELALAIGINYEKQIATLEFGKKIAWIGLTRSDATALASLLLKYATMLDPLSKENE